MDFHAEYIFYTLFTYAGVHLSGMYLSRRFIRARVVQDHTHASANVDLM